MLTDVRFIERAALFDQQLVQLARGFLRRLNVCSREAKFAKRN